ncbi:hypothetical protein EDD21DRAFT_360208 [Dissophora ornata]|nr:hypothetical protein EDD21DRAFT_360208 [Dissophora ornata]
MITSLALVVRFITTLCDIGSTSTDNSLSGSGIIAGGCRSSGRKDTRAIRRRLSDLDHRDAMNTLHPIIVIIALYLNLDIAHSFSFSVLPIPLLEITTPSQSIVICQHRSSSQCNKIASRVGF